MISESWAAQPLTRRIVSAVACDMPSLCFLRWRLCRLSLLRSCLLLFLFFFLCPAVFLVPIRCSWYNPSRLAIARKETDCTLKNDSVRFYRCSLTLKSPPLEMHDGIIGGKCTRRVFQFAT